MAKIPYMIRLGEGKTYNIRFERAFLDKIKILCDQVRSRFGFHLTLHGFMLGCINNGMIIFEGMCESLCEDIVNFRVSLKDRKKYYNYFEKVFKNKSIFLIYLMKLAMKEIQELLETTKYTELENLAKDKIIKKEDYFKRLFNESSKNREEYHIWA